jgi:WD40 repeat protein
VFICPSSSFVMFNFVPFAKLYCLLFNSICFSPDSKQIVSCSQDETIRVWNAQTGVSVCLLSGHTGVCTVAFSQDGKHHCETNVG